MWVDTSVTSRDVYVYSSDTAAWEAVSPETIYQQNTAPTNANDGDVWIDTDSGPPQDVKTYDAGTNAWDDITPANTAYTRIAGGYTAIGGSAISDGDTATTVTVSPSTCEITGTLNAPADGVRFNMSDTSGSPEAHVYFTDGSSTKLGSPSTGWNTYTHDADKVVDHYEICEVGGGFSVGCAEIQPHEPMVAGHNHAI